MGKQLKILVAIVVFGLIVSDVYKFDFFVKDFFSSPISLFSGFFSDTGAGFSNVLKPFFSFYKFSDENQSLKEENSRLIGENVYLKLKIKELEALGGIKEQNFIEQKLIGARIIGRDSLLAPSYLILDKGRDDGIRDSLSVIDAHNFLIGKIIRTYQNSSVVDLVYNFTSPATVRLLNSGVLALAGKSDFNSFFVDLIDKNINIEIGEIVATAGDDQVEGLILGRIKKIVNGDVFNSAYGEFLADFKNSYLVFVIEK